MLATPPRWRPLTAVIGAAYAVWMTVAVVALGWHYPTDALAGLAFGVGVVLLADGASWTVFGRRVGFRAVRPDHPPPRPRGLAGFAVLPVPHLPVVPVTHDGHGAGGVVGVEMEVDRAIGIVGLARCLDHQGGTLAR